MAGKRAVPWFAVPLRNVVDQGFAGLSHGALGLYLDLFGHAALLETDGLMTGETVRALCRQRKNRHATQHIDELVASGLLSIDGDGYRLGDYLTVNSSRVERDAIREGGRRRQAKKRATERAEPTTDGSLPGPNGAGNVQGKDQKLHITGSLPPRNVRGNDPENGGIVRKNGAGNAPNLTLPKNRSDQNSLPDRDRDLVTPHANADALACEGEGFDHDQSWRWFCRNYGKTPPKALRGTWPRYCPDRATFLQIREGIVHWRRSRAWYDDNPNGDYTTKAEDWLAEKMYLERPVVSERWLAEHPEEAAHAEHQGRAGGAAPARPKVYRLGDNDDPYWAANAGRIGRAARGRAAPADEPVDPDEGRGRRHLSPLPRDRLAAP